MQWEFYLWFILNRPKKVAKVNSVKLKYPSREIVQKKSPHVKEIMYVYGMRSCLLLQ